MPTTCMVTSWALPLSWGEMSQSSADPMMGVNDTMYLLPKSALGASSDGVAVSHTSHELASVFLPG